MGTGMLPRAVAESVTTPTLVLHGDSVWAGPAAETAVAVLPHGTRRALTGQSHNFEVAVLAPVVTAFLEATGP